MTATRKTMRFITVLALILMMVFSITSVPASAAGVETWYAATVTEPVIPMSGYNLTPVKTMGVQGVLYIQAEFETTSNIMYPNKPYYLLEIRSLDGRVLARSGYSEMCVTSATQETHVFVNAGQKVQIYTAVYDQNTGVWYNANVKYKHWIATLER